VKGQRVPCKEGDSTNISDVNKQATSGQLPENNINLSINVIPPYRPVNDAIPICIKHTHTRPKPLGHLFENSKYKCASVYTGNTFQDLPRLRETADNTERYI
jgi:hypothetical protein